MDTTRAINDACRRRGGVYSTYSCKAVSWDDSSRGQGMGGLSSVGPNITDVYLKAKDGTPLFTVRSDNWNEKLGSVSSAAVAVIGGNTLGAQNELKPLTLCDLLSALGSHGRYAGLPSPCDLNSEALDRECSIRFQTTFLPVAKAGGFHFGQGAGTRESIEFATEAFNYQTRSDEDPKNLVLLCTTQGVAVQADGASATRLYHHRVDSSGTTHRHWLEAERSEHKVGGAQAETAAEKADALARGKATAAVIGPECVGTRFNVLMTIQVPLRQQQPPPTFGGGGVFGGAPSGGALFGAAPKSLGCSAPSMQMGGTFGAAPVGGGFMSGGFLGAPAAPPCPVASFGAMGGGMGGGFSGGFGPGGCVPRGSAPTGVSNAARVSMGSKHDAWGGLVGHGRRPSRHDSQRVTITVVMYNTCVGGAPTEADVAAAIDDLEALYAACRAEGRAQLPQFNAPTPTPFPTPPAPPLPPPPPAVTDAATFPTPTKPPVPFGASPFAPFGDVPAPFSAQELPMTHDGFTYLCNAGLSRLSNVQASRELLGEAFALFRLADEMHVQINGYPDHTCLYNLACCCSRLASPGPAAAGSLPNGFGPSPFAAVAETSLAKTSPVANPASLSAEGCLNAGIAWLRTAAAAGWSDAPHMRKDSDLEALRQHRAHFFETAVKLAETAKQGM